MSAGVNAVAGRAEIHLTCALVWSWIVRDGRCAVVRNDRADGSFWWSLPGGGVEDGETLAEAALRQAREETGLEVRLQGLARLREDLSPQGRWLAAEFVAEAVGGSEADRSDPDGTVGEVRWAAPQEVGELLGPAAAEFLLRLLRQPPDPGNYGQRRT